MQSTLVRGALLTALAASMIGGCEEPERSEPQEEKNEQPLPSPGPQPGGANQGAGGNFIPDELADDDLPDDDLPDDDLPDDDLPDDDLDEGWEDTGDVEDDDLGHDGGEVLPPEGAPPAAPSAPQQTAVPSELVGAWEAGYIDFALWESYPEGRWAGRDAIPSREAMILRANGEAKFYRYEFARNLYEELIDCEGTVAFHGDGTFTFYPRSGRKRFHDFTTPTRSADRALSAAELSAPKLAGTRAYTFVSASPATVQIRVPGSAPYNWYRKEE